MGQRHKPRSGSLAFYPRKRALKETPSFNTFPVVDSIKPLNFFGFKAGMVEVFGKNVHEKSATFGADVAIPASILEVPPLKVFGIRAYSLNGSILSPLIDVIAEKLDKHLRRKLKHFKLKGAKSLEGKAGEKDVPSKTVSDLEKEISNISKFHLLVHTQPYLTGIGKKKPSVSEIELGGKVEEQLNYAKQKLGQELSISEVFSEKQFVDVKAVTKGKGFQGVVKRFGVKTQRPKAKVSRKIGSIGPWHPATVMWTVARAGQMGYHTRTEYNKRILKIGQNPEEVNPDSGFNNYGKLKNAFVILQGTIPGPSKRLIGLRVNSRPAPSKGFRLEKIDVISAKM